jgi:hypothetical protein
LGVGIKLDHAASDLSNNIRRWFEIPNIGLIDLWGYVREDYRDQRSRSDARIIIETCSYDDA